MRSDPTGSDNNNGRHGGSDRHGPASVNPKRRDGNPDGPASAGPSGPSGDNRKSKGANGSRAESGGPAAIDLVRAREQLLGLSQARRLDAPSLRQALVDLHELWLTGTAGELGIGPESGCAIVAVGGLARGEMLPYSDLDLILLHDGSDLERIGGIAERLWYPLWDAHIKLDHSVRTVAEALQVAASDMTAALGLLDARHIAGDADLTAVLVAEVRRQWRIGVRSRLDELIELTRQRWQRSGDVAQRAEPDTKNGHGGLRDIQLIDALAVAQLTDPAIDPGAQTGGGVAAAHARLLDVRTELHRVARRARDQVRVQDADEIAAALRLGDRFDLARSLSDSARTVSYAVDAGLRNAGNSIPRRGLARLRAVPLRRPLDEGVVNHAGEIVLARDAQPSRDPGLVLRVAAAAARTGMPIGAATLVRLADTAPELRTPWPRGALKDLLVVLGSGPRAIPVIEALDRTGLWGRLIPEWGAVRDLPPRDAIHTWTVDRHLMEVASIAGTFATRVSRPDLLVLSAILHDIGKGRGGDHSVIGAELAERIATRMGLWPSDIDIVVAVVRHHLLLPQVATRRDLDDVATVQSVVDAIGGDIVVLEVLHALAEADSIGTGPGVWGEWKASLIAELVRRCRMVMVGEPLPQPQPLDPELVALAERGEIHVDVKPLDENYTFLVSVVAPDRRGALTAAAGVLALHSLRVVSASVGGDDSYAIDTFVVSPHFGDPPPAELIRQDVIRALDGRLDPVAEISARRDRELQSAGASTTPDNAQAPPRVLWFAPADGDDSRVIVELRAEDRPGLLARVAGALHAQGADICWARVETLGNSVVDAFCVRLGPNDAGTSERERRETIEQALLAVVPAAPPPPPEENSGGR